MTLQSVFNALVKIRKQSGRVKTLTLFHKSEISQHSLKERGLKYSILGVGLLCKNIDCLHIQHCTFSFEIILVNLDHSFEVNLLLETVTQGCFKQFPKTPRKERALCQSVHLQVYNPFPENL